MKTINITRPAGSSVNRVKRFSTIPSLNKARRIIACLLENKAEDVIGFDLNGIHACMDAVIVATAGSGRHARSLADQLNKFAREQQLEWLHMEGYQTADWVLVDMNDVVVHIFTAQRRVDVNPEALWKDLERIDPSIRTEADDIHDRMVAELKAEKKAGTDDEDTVPGVTMTKGRTSRGEVDAVPVQTGRPVPTLFLILDGYGLAEATPYNAAAQAATPNLKRLMDDQARVSLSASGRSVGLPSGFMGNSEVGHLNLGAGRIVWQDMTRIDMALEDGTLASNQVLTSLLDAIRTQGGRLHLLGLLSDGGVHSHIRHVQALVRIAGKIGVPIVMHAFTDGRDTPPSSAIHYVSELTPILKAAGGIWGSLCGRFYAMDRDKRWERVGKAWGMLVHGKGASADDPITALKASYATGKTDEFVEPTLLDKDACIRDGDGVFMFNFRADRARELARCFIPDTFDGFERGHLPKLAGMVCMTNYDATLPQPVLFTKDNLVNTIGEVVAKKGWRQLRIAETEKYAHVTYFFSGGREEVFENEDRILIDSPKDVATYDLKPEMSVYEVTGKLLDAWNSGIYDFIVCNLANCDMVGHTGVFHAALKALSAVDECVGRIADTVAASGGRLVITADHGNIETMKDPETGQPHTAHTTNPVPLIVLDRGRPVKLKEGGKLGDIAPTILTMWGVRKPSAMTGVSLYARPRTKKA